MKKIATLIFILQSLTVFSQFSDNFSDGLFTNITGNRNVEWTGDVGDFIVNSNKQLQLSATGKGPSQLRTSFSALKNASWEFYVKMDFEPTTANYARIYLASDEEDLKGELNGFFVRIGHSDKNICLMASQKGKDNQILIKGTEKRLNSSSNAVKIKATLNENGNLNLYSQLESENDFTLEGSCTITNLPVSRWFGIVCTYSSTRSKHFFFDDFVVTGSEIIPEPAPELPKEGDIVFSEIMANPANGNPEYVEFYNTTDRTFQLKTCLFYYGDKSFTLPDKTVDPHSYFVLTKTTATNQFNSDVEVCGVTSFPSLANTGKLLMFGNTSGELISWFEYSDKMYGDNEKKKGGWSLECIDLANQSNTANNWLASNDSLGGTPGKVNSVAGNNPDTIMPEIISYNQTEDQKVKVIFSKPMKRNILLNKNSYQISDAGYQISDLQTNYPQGTELTVELDNFPPKGNFIEIKLKDMEDLSGNALSTDNVLIIGEAYEAEANDVIINELLFNPPANGNEYVEIYNRSNKLIDLRSLSITSRKPSDGSLNKLYPLTAIPLFLNPGEYLVITKNKDLVCNFFNCKPETFYIQLPVMPSIANTSGCVVLINSHTNVILDEFAYNEKMHSKEITNRKGIALERISFNKSGNDENNWASATAQSGYGTPGYENSQHSASAGLIEPANKAKIELVYPVNDMDGYRIKYQLDKHGYKCNVYLYDSSGRLIDNILNNKPLETDGEIIWNGRNVQKSSSGLYILYVELLNSINGDVQKFKLPVVMK
ncbi:MAG: lamin tail domain-containing protein [Dysgonamonadaceae bacterium]|nr:lamin tail domain-containing protein [Dysgonamonadaceae bacterium]